MSYYVGLDVGSCYCKCIIINEGEIKVKSISLIESSPEIASKKVLNEALASLNLKMKKIKKIVSIGRNKKKVPFKNHGESEIKCIARGVKKVIPSVNTIVDLGALTNKAIKLDSKGKVLDYVINDKCASGSGMFLELVARALEMDIKELGKSATLSKNPLSITNQCSIFAESEVIYLVNEGKNDLDIAAGVSNSIASRIFTLLLKVKMEKDITLTGGVANNEQISKALEDRLQFKLKNFSIDPIYIGAYGAALFASEM